MEAEEVLEIFRECDALLEGHFILSSGLRSPVFLQKARVFSHAGKTERLCKALAGKIAEAGLGKIDCLVGLALGGIVPAYETSRHLGVPNLWVEREEGEFRLRRFEIEKGARIVVIEDIISTGLSVRESIVSLRSLGAEVLAVGCIADRSGGKADVGAPLIALAHFDFPAYSAEKLPPELQAIEPVTPGSRWIQNRS